MAIIKKAPIIKSYQVNAYCSNCGKIIKFIRASYPEGSNVLHYVHKCSNCGNEEMLKTTYPHQIVQFDTSKEEIINDISGESN